MFIIKPLLAVFTFWLLWLPAGIADDKLRSPAQENASVERLQQAIRIPTVSPDSGLQDERTFREFQTLLKKSYPNLFRHLKLTMVSDHSMAHVWAGTEASLLPIAFLAHYDVVPALSDQWSKDPFSGEDEGGYIWGRGALDNKANVMSYCEVLENLVQKNMSPRRTIYFFFGHDEELGGANGAKAWAADLKSRSVHFESVIDEGLFVVKNVVPGMGAKPVAMVGVAEKGFMTVRVKLSGASGHSSMPGKDSIVIRMGEIAKRFQEKPMSANLQGLPRDFFAAISEGAGFPLNTVFAHARLFDPVLKFALSGKPSSNALTRTTTAVTKFQSGQKDNVLPESAELTLNFRIHPNDTIEAVRSHIDQILLNTGATYTVDSKSLSPPSAVSPQDSSTYLELKENISKTFPGAISAPSLVLAGTDSRHFSELTQQTYRFTALVMDQEDLPRFHGIDERVSVNDYLNLIRYQDELIRALAF